MNRTTQTVMQGKVESKRFLIALLHIYIWNFDVIYKGHNVGLEAFTEREMF